MKLSIFLFILSLLGCCSYTLGSTLNLESRPAIFVDLQDLETEKQVSEDSRIIVNMAYATDENFIGRVIPGYLANKCILTRPAAEALLLAQKKLLTLSYSIIVFDCYRPQKSVDAFVAWCHDENDIKNKKDYYPDIEKKADLLDIYIATRSGHSRGSTIDIGLWDINRNIIVNMGSRFDFFGEISHTNSRLVNDEQRIKRRKLVEIIESVGFKNYPLEWWHFSFVNEPFKRTYFNFDIK